MSWRKGLKISAAVSAAMLLLLVEEGWAQQANKPFPSHPVPYYEADKKYVDRVFQLMTDGGVRPISDLRKWYYPVVVRLPQLICVGMNLVGGPGDTSTYCFNPDGGKLVVEFSW